MEQPTAQIAGWEHGHVQDETLDKAGLPFQPSLFRGQTPCAVGEDILHRLDPTAVPLDRISPSHGRSYEVGSAPAVTGIWADRYGNRYTSLSYKGNNFTKPDITRSATAPSGFIPYGLQEDDALLRVLKSSRLLRENGIPTEWLVSVFEPSVLPFGDELVSQHEYKQRLLASKLGEWSVTEAAEIATAIAPMTFFVTVRCMEINDRPVDFLDDPSEEAIRNRLRKVFTVYNNLHAEDKELRVLDAASDEDCRYYFTELLPRLQGMNLARLHDMGLVHKFPVPGNTTALGGIIDLDSIHGEPIGIGDAPITFDDIRRDIHQVFDNDYRSYHDILRHLNSQTDWFADSPMKTANQMRLNFLAAYTEQSRQKLSTTDLLLLYAEAADTDEDYFFTLELHPEVLRLVEPMGVAELIDGFGSLLRHAREKRAGALEAYAMRAWDEAYLRARPADFDDKPAVERYSNFLFWETFGEVEKDALADTLALVEKGEALPAYHALLGRLGLTWEKEPGAATLLAHAILTLSSVYGEMEQPDEALQEILDRTNDVLHGVLSHKTRRYTHLIFEKLEQLPIEEHTDKAKAMQRYRKYPYKILTAVSREQLMEAIDAEKEAEIRIYYDHEGSDSRPDAHVRSLPVTRFITDAPFAQGRRYVSERGEYRCAIAGAGEMTYAASVSLRDDDGVFHIIITDQVGVW